MIRVRDFFILSVISFSLFAPSGCKQLTGELDDQAPVLIVNIEIVNDPGNTIQFSKTNKVYLIYYTESNWTNPWLTYGSSTATLINPTVITFSLYLAAFWDANGNGVLDSGEPCTGFDGIAPTNPLTELTLLPLEWRTLTIALDPAVTYP
jgi:hypothetical protein